MGVYIKGMEMPKNCAECFFHKVFPATGVGINQLYCALCGINIVKMSDALPDCPLVPVPPHGRLIDGDVAEVIHFTEEDAAGKDFYDGILYAADFINKQPTIVPAEEGE